MMALRGVVVGALMLSACGRYADFTLPAPEGRAANVVPRWQAEPQPVMGPGTPGEWDSVDALNPSVVRRGSQYLNLYSGFDGKVWHTGLAVSADGLAWTKRGRVLSPGPAAWEGAYWATNGTALEFNGQIYYWYQAGSPPRLGLARSADGVSWSKLPEPVVETGPRGSWDERGIADPYVIRVGEWLYLFYLGEDRARRQRLGIARSPDGVAWEKLRSNPILELGQADTFDEAGLGEPAVFASHGRYWMLYTGRDRKEFRRIGVASSLDGVHWKRVEGVPAFSGDQAWNSKVICDPTVEMGSSGIRVWFGGGDVAHPVERIHGQIGVATLRLEAQ